MSRAVWQLGQAVRECGIALERAGARLSTDYSFTEPRECSLCSFSPPGPQPPPRRSWGTTQSAGVGIRRTRARARVRAAGRKCAQLHHCAGGVRQGPFGRSAPMPSGGARLPARQRRERHERLASAERRSRCRSAGWPFGTLRLQCVGAGAHPESLARLPRRLRRGGGDKQSSESLGRRSRGRHSEALHLHACAR